MSSGSSGSSTTVGSGAGGASSNSPVLRRRRFHDQPERHRIQRDGLDAPHLGTSEYPLLPRVIVRKRVGGLLYHLLGAAYVGSGLYRDVDDGTRPLLRFIADA